MVCDPVYLSLQISIVPGKFITAMKPKGSGHGNKKIRPIRYYLTGRKMSYLFDELSAAELISHGYPE